MVGSLVATLRKIDARGGTPATAIRTLKAAWHAVSGETSRQRVERQVLDRLAQCLSDAPQVRLDYFGGRFYVGARSDLFKRIVGGDYEKDLVQRLVAKQPFGRDAIDVGANCGFYTILFATRSPNAKVLSIEPTDGAIALLRRNVELNGLHNVVVRQCIVSSDVGEATLNFIEGREEYSSAGEMSHPSIGTTAISRKTVPAMTIDTLVREEGLDCGLIKIDVEGHEASVIKGAGETLRSSRPIVLAELTDPLLRRNGSSSAEVIAAIESFGYDVIDPLAPDQRAGQREFGDILCLPKA